MDDQPIQRSGTTPATGRVTASTRANRSAATRGDEINQQLDLMRVVSECA
jgi:hypothetical protein